MDKSRKGHLITMSCFILWGLFPIYWSFLGHIDPLELLLHRVFWIVAPLSIYLLCKNKLLLILSLLKKYFVKILLCAIFIALNWYLFVYGILENKVSEVSFGYYLNPLINISLGALVFKESFTRRQVLSISFAVLGVMLLTVENEGLPWISLGVSSTFAIYAVLKKQFRLPILESLYLESSFIFIALLMYYSFFGDISSLDFFNQSNFYKIYISFAGITTFGPLLLFNFGIALIPLSRVGLMQFIAPTLQFILSVVLFNESFSYMKWVSFLLIWIALTIFCIGLFKKDSKNVKNT